MIRDSNIPRIEQKHACHFVESDVAGIVIAVSKDGWAVSRLESVQGLAGDWKNGIEGLKTIIKELEGLQEMFA
jgi:hypothetical protein